MMSQDELVHQLASRIARTATRRGHLPPKGGALSSAPQRTGVDPYAGSQGTSGVTRGAEVAPAGPQAGGVAGRGGQPFNVIQGPGGVQLHVYPDGRVVPVTHGQRTATSQFAPTGKTRVQREAIRRALKVGGAREGAGPAGMGLPGF